ncbi:hypothetical protein BC332_00764 [Capsicum chinense]|nr:hypothetical protein BC332_00764 [Capsicum chinense]
MVITSATFRNTQFLLTLCGNFSEIEGSELQVKMEKQEYPVILEKNIGISSYQAPAPFIDHIQQMLSNKLFHIQLRKSSWVSSNATHTNLTILSYTEKKQLLPSIIENRNAKKAMSPGISGVGMEATIIESGTSNATSSTELVAPPKKL